MYREDVPLFCVSFSELLYFCRFFFQFTDAFFGSILPIFAYFFAVYYVYFIKSQTVFWAQNFRDVQLFPNFLRYPAWLCIAAFGRHCCNKLPNRWILIQQ